MICQILLEEVARLTEVIESMDKPRAFDLGRRGAIYRKLGKLKKASDDINRYCTVVMSHYMYCLLYM